MLKFVGPVGIVIETVEKFAGSVEEY